MLQGLVAYGAVPWQLEQPVVENVLAADPDFEGPGEAVVKFSQQLH